MELPWARVHIPDSCRGQPIIVGIDEAGRGPVLGSLVYCALFWPAKEHDEISKLEFNDSKQLSEEEREKLFSKISKHNSIGWVIEELTAEKLSREMLRGSPISLNTISYDGVVRMLETISNNNSGSGEAPIVTDVYVDTVGDPSTYQMKLEQKLGKGFAKFIIEKKADAKFKVVSAASIVAKVSRDRLLRDWKWKEGNIDLDKKFGSGYPSDETCVEWLDRSVNPIFGYPNLVRFSWSTTKEALNRNGAVVVKWECEDEESGSANITSFFSAAGEKRSKRCNYFVSKRMKHILPGSIDESDL